MGSVYLPAGAAAAVVRDVEVGGDVERQRCQPRGQRRVAVQWQQAAQPCDRGRASRHPHVMTASVSVHSCGGTTHCRTLQPHGTWPHLDARYATFPIFVGLPR